MIDELEIRDVALIEKASISPSEHMTAITGETGSGKTALLSACRMVMGSRADKDMVRESCKEATVDGRLFIDDEEIVVNRRISSDGRSRVRIDGAIASVSELADIAGPTISLCSQHDQVSLVRSSRQLELLDSWAHIRESAEYVEYQRSLEDAGAAANALAELRQKASAQDDRLQEARFVSGQIGALDPSVEDYEELTSSLRKAQNAELLARTSSEVHDALSGENGALDLINASLALLEEGSRADDGFSEFSERLRDALYSIEDVARDIGRLDDAFEFDVASVGLMQERVAAYQSLMRSFGPTVEDLVLHLQDARDLIATHENADAMIEAAESELARAEAALSESARRLHKLREKEAVEFSKAIDDVLSELEMAATSISCSVEMSARNSWGVEGPDKVELMFTPAPGMNPRPLSKIASGGELGRVMLAVHVVMGKDDGVDTLVFDEVDSGIGGHTASAMASVLSRLAQTHQVIVVTHSAQIASKADRHYLVSKSADGGSVRTDITQVWGDTRVNEIARMMSGELTETSLEHARELLQ